MKRKSFPRWPSRNSEWSKAAKLGRALSPAQQPAPRPVACTLRRRDRPVLAYRSSSARSRFSPEPARILRARSARDFPAADLGAAAFVQEGWLRSSSSAVPQSKAPSVAGRRGSLGRKCSFWGQHPQKNGIKRDLQHRELAHSQRHMVTYSVTSAELLQAE